VKRDAPRPVEECAQTLAELRPVHGCGEDGHVRRCDLVNQRAQVVVNDAPLSVPAHAPPIVVALPAALDAHGGKQDTLDGCAG